MFNLASFYVIHFWVHTGTNTGALHHVSEQHEFATSLEHTVLRLIGPDRENTEPQMAPFILNNIVTADTFLG